MEVLRISTWHVHLPVVVFFLFTQVNGRTQTEPPLGSEQKLPGGLGGYVKRWQLGSCLVPSYSYLHHSQ